VPSSMMKTRKVKSASARSSKPKASTVGRRKQSR
jgi:hypothetical protein